MFVLPFLPLNVDNLIHARPEACFPSFTKCPVSELLYINQRRKKKKEKKVAAEKLKVIVCFSPDIIGERVGWCE